MTPLRLTGGGPHATARTYRFRDAAGTIGFINPVSEPSAPTATAGAYDDPIGN